VTDKKDILRKYKEPSFTSLKGLCCVTHPEFAREGSLLGERIGIYEVNNPIFQAAFFVVHARCSFSNCSGVL
jgi:hypothetical protein